MLIDRLGKTKRGRIDKCKKLTPACAGGGLNVTRGRRLSRARLVKFKVWRREEHGEDSLKEFPFLKGHRGEEIQITTISMRFFIQAH